MKTLRLPRLRRVRTSLVPASLAFLLGCACLNAAIPAPPPAPAPADTLRVGIGIQPDNLEISQVTNSAVANLLEHVVETLVTVNENGQIVPELAQTWEVSPDGLQYTFHLPTAATFQDGAPLDASAVVWNFNRLQAIQAAVTTCPVAAQLAPIQGVAAVNATTVTYTLSRPVPNFLATLSWISFGILSPRSENAFGNKLLNIQHPVGTGPFTFGTLSAGQLQLSRFDRYRGQQPYFSSLVFKFIATPQGRDQALAAGQVDVILLPSAAQLAIYAGDSRYVLLTRPSTRTIYVNLNNQKAPFNDVRVRRAVNLAIDKQAIIDQVLQGAGTVLDSPLAPSVAGYCPVGSYAYDPAAARALLAEANVAPGTPLTLLTPRGRYLEDEAVAQRVAGYLRDVGFAVTVQALDWPALSAALYKPPQQVTADLHLFGWAPTFADAGWQLPQLYDSKKWPPVGPATSFYQNSTVDGLLDAAVQEANPGTRQSLFCQAEQAIWNDAPAIFLWAQSFPVVSRADVTNLVSLPSEKVQVAFARRVATAPAAKVGGSASQRRRH